MNETVTEAEFLSSVRNEQPCFLHTKIEVLQNLISNLGDLDLHLHPASSGWDAVRGLCPLCASWIPGEILGMILVVTQTGREKLTLSSYGDISRLMDAHCINEKCPCQDILIIWQGDQSIKRQLVRHLDRLRADAVAKDSQFQLSAVERMGIFDIIAFAQDALFSLERRCKSSHLIVGRRFDNLVVWVSVLPPLQNALRDTFPSGYRSYLDSLLYTSGFEAGDIMVAHWVSFVEEGQRLLNLALLSEKNSIGTSREFAIIPAEIP